MSYYLDTSAILKLYKNESFSDELSCWVREQEIPIFLSPFQELEFKNAIMLNVFHKNIDLATGERILKWFSDDIKNGVYNKKSVQYSAIFSRAQKVALKWTRTVGSRSLDIIHVGTALELEHKVFVTFDLRQAEIVRKTGLELRTWV